MSAVDNPGPLVEPLDSLSPREFERYARHLSLPGIGVEGQRRLRAASALVIGAGGLGAPVLHYLAAAGIGTITIIDDDVVEASNLQRQVLHRGADIGRAKVDSARDALLRLDPLLEVHAVAKRLSPANVLELFASHDLVLDGADNFATRYLSNDAAELTGTPLIWGTIFRFAGQVSTFVPGHGPMLRDLFPDIPEADSVPNCAEGGVLGVLCGTIGSAMATEAVKLICGIGTPLIGRLLRYDALESDYSTLRFSPDPDREPVTDLAEVAVACAAARAEADGDGADREDEIGVDEYLADPSSALLIDVRADWERHLASIPGSVHLPLGVLQVEGWPAVETLVTLLPREVVIHCKSGARSAQAVQLLRDAAPESVRLRSLDGGIDAWSASEHETVQSSGQTAVSGSHHT
ncbi:molybdopterin-synthase adenylyltransferase MoeB [Brevibacterium sp. UCMA 11754]|uniref:molybdopterin-synthase adenylyltransferase MoeB n=1 Tax=Brevibacterium sp. UCMA 11754 TaxID=2749198 RepID=UPI001F23A93C|nr:molybdopterin-synthase adenylyltransferase MoeB [Brevibacterium sp. UCMA 11754]MCF2574131.1 molybdopterin-synthase adenylyltransferase MoeB [Brevibacterium sp. UCMA 11754]MCF2574137.1 molybdopterin-synthase adenylyltransferase MoeB [Brevibacterium sp. UCMA 11754]